MSRQAQFQGVMIDDTGARQVQFQGIMVNETQGSTAYTLVSSPASFAITPQASALNVAWKLITAPAVYVVTPRASGLNLAWKLVTSPAVYVVNPQSSGMTVSGPVAHTLITAPASFVIICNASGLTVAVPPASGGSRGPAIADAIVSELLESGQPWNIGGIIDASRTWLPVYNPRDVQALKVAVFSMTMDNTKISRPNATRMPGYTWEVYGTVIDFQLAATFDTTGAVIQAPLDAADLLVEQVYDFYQDAHHITAAGKTWLIQTATRAEVYDLQRLYSDSVWETAIALVIKGQV